MTKEGWDLYYWTDRVRARSMWDPHRPKAEVLEGQMGARFVAITIRIRDSRWICHPYKTKDRWSRDRFLKPSRTSDEPARRVPRHIRKAAKLALRRFLNP